VRPLTRNAALDGLRGFAVLLVFCVHAAGNAAHVFLHVNLDRSRWASLASPAERLLFWLNRSHHGVFLFFVLSGFLIARMWAQHPRPGYAAFVARRTMRIYPAFLLAFAGSLLFAYHSATWQPPDWPRIGANLLFLNGLPSLSVDPFNIVTWSLFYEAVFYGFYPFALLVVLRWSGARGRAVLAAAGIGLPVAAVAAGADPIHLCWTLLFLGVLAAQDGFAAWIARGRIAAPAIVAVYLGVTTTGLADAVPPAALTLAFGAAAVLVLLACDRGDNALARLFAARPLVALGRISYSFYLWHWMVVVLVARAFEGAARPLPPRIGVPALFAGSFVAAAAIATLAWWLAERPYFRRQRGSVPAPG
jgi:exopolysaccharide production protein ExoZ